MTFVDIVHLPSTGVFAKTALCDLDLHLGVKFKIFISLKRLEPAQNVLETFVDFNICHRMV